MPFVPRLATNDNKKSLFLATFDPNSSIVKSVFDCLLSAVVHVLDYMFWRLERRYVKCGEAGVKTFRLLLENSTDVTNKPCKLKVQHQTAVHVSPISLGDS